MTNTDSEFSGEPLQRAWVDPFIGLYPGQSLCGPYLPYGVVRLGPDAPVGQQGTNGYGIDVPIARFSHTHVSGTGGASRYGNIGITPLIGSADTWREPVAYHARDERAEPGYYAVSLEPGAIEVELTVTPHVGVHRYTFPAIVEEFHLLIDAGAVIQPMDIAAFPREHSALSRVGMHEYAGASIGGWVAWSSPTDVIGRADYRGGWGHNDPYSVFFALRFDRPATTQRVAVGQSEVIDHIAAGPQSKAIATFHSENATIPSTVQVWVGISYVSIAHASASLTREVGVTQRDVAASTESLASFDIVRTQAAAVWDKTLQAMSIAGGSAEQRTLFATLFTRLVCLPTDLGVDDEFALWHSGVRQFSDFYCFWDSVRNANQLITLIDPAREAMFLRAALDIAEHRGWLPDAWIAGQYGQAQGGSTVDILFCEAALKNLPGLTRDDYQRALMYMIKNATTPSPDPFHMGRDLQHGAPSHVDGLPISPLHRVSSHLEYTYQDWCAGTLATCLGEATLADEAYARAATLWDLWRDDLRCFAPRQPDGEWVAAFDPDHLAEKRWLDPYFYEATGRQWSFQTFHDFAGLVQRHGGAEAFVYVLDAFFDTEQYMHKETLMHIPYLYHYAGRPDKSAERVHDGLHRYYHATRDGLSDDEDMGCQSSWYLWSMMGIYPIMGQDLYLLTTPSFTDVRVALGNTGNYLTIHAPEAGREHPYIASVTLNGVPLERSWLLHDEIAHGATLRYTLSPTPTRWAFGITPPSPSTPNVKGTSFG